ncbi:response regulator transcription factor [Zobellella maritima]|uniref:response regulator transcription factor n=1 Tax=Zobellella maritima TaxID=2059725 RepID=UPI000E304193|nr:response regulator transcription factor [Zobellella maritima]
MNSLNPQKLLIVDNEPLITEELGEFFTDHGFSCFCCHSADEAVQVFSTTADINLVLSDLHMPGQNGLQLLQKLIFIARQESRPVEAILFTGQSEKDDIITALKTGIADYFQKPLDMAELLAGVRRLAARLAQNQQALSISSLNQRMYQLTESLQELYQDINHLHQTPEWQPNQMPAPEDGLIDQDPTRLPSLLEKLSPRQQEVALLIGKGMTNYQIAHELGITENTVKLYASQILRLTNMTNRTQLALALTEPLQL